MLIILLIKFNMLCDCNPDFTCNLALHMSEGGCCKYQCILSNLGKLNRVDHVCLHLTLFPHAGWGVFALSPIKVGTAVLDLLQRGYAS